MTKEELLAQLREMGYDGDSDEDAFQFIQDNGGLNELSDEEVMEILGTKAEDEDEDEEEKSAGPLSFKTLKKQSKNADPETLRRIERQLIELNKKSVRPEDRKAASGVWADTKGRGDSPEAMRYRAERKRYEKKIERGTAHFSDPDIAAGTGAYLKSVVLGWNDAESRDILKSMGVKAHTITSPAAIGNLIPTEFSQDIVSNFEQYGVAAQQFDIEQMGESNTLDFPIERNRLTMYRPGENTLPSAQSDLAYGIGRLIARDRIAYSYITNNAIADSAINVAERWSQRYVEDVTYSQDLSAFRGDGTSTYLGDTGLEGAFETQYGVNVASGAGSEGFVVGGTTTHDNWDALTEDDFKLVVANLPEYADGNAKWYCHKSFFHQTMDQLAREKGGTTYAEQAGSKLRQYLGYEVVFVQVMPKAINASVGEIVCYFGDLKRAAKMGVRQNIEVATSTDYKFAENATTIRGVTRDAFNVHSVGTSGGDAGPVIALQTASA